MPLRLSATPRAVAAARGISPGARLYTRAGAMRRRWMRTMLISFAAAGCEAGPPNEALLTAVEPSPVSAGVATTLTLIGEEFGLRVKAKSISASLPPV